MTTLEEHIAAAHPGADLGQTKDGTVFWRVSAGMIGDAVTLLQRAGVDRFLDLTAVDDPTRDDRFELNYLFYTSTGKRWFRLKARTNGDAPSITAQFAGADFYEREVFDLFGVRFVGHPNLTRLLLPDDWQGHPLRRDEPLGGEPVDFTVTRDVYGT